MPVSNARDLGGDYFEKAYFGTIVGTIHDAVSMVSKYSGLVPIDTFNMLIQCAPVNHTL